jgi:two-component system, cell cycle response regulator DivK
MIRVAEAGDIPVTESSHSRPLILVVEDNESTAEFMRVALGFHFSVSVVHSVRDALEVLATKHVDAVCTDISLGEGPSGFDLIREMKAAPCYAGIPLIAVTAHAIHECRDACFEAGCDDVLFKPFGHMQLVTLLKTYLRKAV